MQYRYIYTIIISKPQTVNFFKLQKQIARDCRLLIHQEATFCILHLLQHSYHYSMNEIFRKSYYSKLNMWRVWFYNFEIHVCFLPSFSSNATKTKLKHFQWPSRLINYWVTETNGEEVFQICKLQNLETANINTFPK